MLYFLNSAARLEAIVRLQGSLEPVLDDITGTLAKPSPAQRVQTAQFLARYINKQPAATLNKKIVKGVAPALVKVHFACPLTVAITC